MASFRSVRADVFEKEERRQQYGAYIKGLNAFERHRKFMEDYVQFYGKCTAGEERRPVKTDQDTLREAYRFIRSEEDDLDSSWEQRLAKRYYEKLFKEYCIADMSKYKEGKIGLSDAGNRLDIFASSGNVLAATVRYFRVLCDF